MFYLESDTITTKQLMKFIRDNSKNVRRFNRLSRYYENKHNIFKKQNKKDNNNKISNDFPGYITDTITGYFIGKPIRYSSEDDKTLDKIKKIFDDNNEQDHNAEIAQTLSICGEAYELLYMDENSNVNFVEIPPQEIIPLFKPKYKQSLKAAIRTYDITDDFNKTTKYADVYFSDRIEHYVSSGGEYTLNASEEHPFGKVPIIYYWNNKQRMGDFEKVITLVDDYDKRISNNSDEMDETDNAYLVLTDMTGTEDEDIIQAKKNKVFKVDNGGKVEFLVKNINDTFVQNNLKTLEKNIHKFSKVPDLSDEAFAGNLSGVAIAYKLWGLEQLASNKERKFKTGIQRRIELIENVLKIKTGNEEKIDVNITFVRNMPQNIVEIVDYVIKLKGTLPEETRLNLLPFVDDAAEVIEQLEQEKDSKLEYEIFTENDKKDVTEVVDSNG